VSDEHRSGGQAAAAAPATSTADYPAAGFDWDVLARATQAWGELPADADPYLLLAEQVREVVADAAVLIATAEAQAGTYRWRALVGDGSPLTELTALLRPAALEQPFTAAAAVGSLVAARGLHEVAGGVRALFADPVTAPGAVDLPAALAPRRVHALGLRWQGGLHGFVAVITPGDAPRPVERTLRALVGLAAVALRQRRAEAAHRRAEARFQELMDLIPGALLECDLTGRITFFNRQALELTGYDEADVRAGLTVASLLVPEDHPRAVASVRRVLGGEPAYGNEYRAVRKDGTQYDLAVYSDPIVEGGRVTGMRGIGIDVTHSRRAQQAREEAERRFRELVDLLPVGVVEADRTGRITFANAHMSRMTGYTPDDVRAGLHLMDLVVESDRERVRAGTAGLVKGETHLNVEYTARHKDGTQSEVAIYTGPILRDGAAVGVRGVAIDITARKRAEEQQRRLAAREQQAQKLESLEVLTRGIAHDFNNLLIAVLGNAELALRDLPASSPASERIAKVHKVAQRAADLVNHLVTYSGGGVVDSRRIDLNEVVADAESLVHESVEATAALRLELAAGLPPIDADPTQIRQIAVNLIINATEAITTPPGVIEVRTGLRQVDVELPVCADCGEDVAPGAYLFLEVHDTGCGMDEATARRIFEPFFTTKFAGRGLGLATVQGIVRRHRGAIWVTSAPGRGTTFTVLLPPASGGDATSR
jgi:PAS domain S-box-containing protein